MYYSKFLNSKGLLILLSILWNIKGVCQEIQFNHLTIENGLSNNSVLAITQDKMGFIWLGTQDGLCRYDGTRFRTFGDNPVNQKGLKSNNLFSLHVDSNEVLWVGTLNGLYRYNFRVDSFEMYSEWPQIRGVLTIAEDKKKNIWLGTMGGLYKIPAENRRKMELVKPTNIKDSITSSRVFALFQDTNEQMWIGSERGLAKLIPNANGYSIEYLPIKFPSTNKNVAITAINEDNFGFIWIGSSTNGLARFNPVSGAFSYFNAQSNSPTRIIHNNIRKIAVDLKGKIWVGTQEGISIINAQTLEAKSIQNEPLVKNTLSQNSVYSLFEDANGSMWVGTYFGGANVTYSINTPFYLMQARSGEKGLNSNVVSSMVEDEIGNLWIATEGGGISYYNRKMKTFKSYKSVPGNPSSLASNLVKVMHLDKDGNLWIGTHGGGLNVLNKTTGTFIRYLYKENDPATQRSEIVSISEKNNGIMYITGNSGLHKFKRTQTNLEVIPIPAKIIGGMGEIDNYVVFEDKENNVWVSSYNGLFRIRNDSIKEKISKNAATHIFQDENSILWIAFRDGGLAKYENGIFKIINHEELNKVEVQSIIGDQMKNLWLGTKSGLYKFNPTTNSIQVYTTTDGLAGNQFNKKACFRDKSGDLYFGGFNGIAFFTPSEIESNKYHVPVFFTGLRVFNKEIEAMDGSDILNGNIAAQNSLKLKYNQNTFNIDFALLNFIKSEKNKFGYKLEGFDHDWNIVSNATASYTNISPGKYTLMVKGANNDGIWGDPVAISIRILPPFWRTWWAYICYTLLLGGIIYLLLRYTFLQAVMRKENELHQLKLNFFTNVSHEIRTHLTLIMAPVENLIQNAKKDKNSSLHQLKMVKNNADKLLVLISELMDFRKAETKNLMLHVQKYNLIDVLSELFERFNELAVSKGIKMKFEYDQPNLWVYFDKIQMEKVFLNLLHNACKFTPKDGSILLKAKESETVVFVSVTDNGIGIKPEFLEKIFTNFFQIGEHSEQNTGYGIGLALSRHILELHQGKVLVESKQESEALDGRTVFTIHLKKGFEHFEHTGFLKSPDAQEMETHLKSTSIMETTAEHIAEISNEEKHPLTILIAEDNDELRSLISRSLEESFNILRCKNGVEAWEISLQQIPDLVISDVMMPEMDGLEFCKLLKADSRTCHIPFIMLTAKTTQWDQVVGFQQGADVYITKPFSTLALLLNAKNLLTLRDRMQTQLNKQLINSLPTNAIKVQASVSNNLDKEFMETLLKLVDENMEDPNFGVEMLSKKLAMSVPILYKKLKAITGMSVNELVKSLRMKKATFLLRQEGSTVYETSYTVGYADSKYFSREFKKQYGISPSEYALSQEKMHKLD